MNETLQNIVEILSGSLSLSCFPDIVPAGTNLPTVAYTENIAPGERCLDGSGYRMQTVTLNVLALTSAECTTLRDAIVAHIETSSSFMYEGEAGDGGADEELGYFYKTFQFTTPVSV